MKSYDCKTCAVGARQSQTLGDFFKKLFLRGKEQTASATVKSRRMASAPVPTPGSTWIHLVAFILEDGKVVELHTTEAQYKELTNGQTGSLTWEGENFLSFRKEL